jgi:SAM-dependent methyltransferase
MHALSPDETGKRYDRISDEFEKNRSLTYGLDYLRKFLSFLPNQRNASQPFTVLDIGCGTGVPLASHLVLCGADVIGIDISAEMISKARTNVPGVSFIEGDILDVRFDRKFDGILAWDSLFHLPFEKQEQAIKKIIGMLEPNGVFLFTAGGDDGELVSMMFSTEFYYSSLSNLQYEQLIMSENCQVILNEIDDPGSHGHRVICCRKNAE